MSITTNKKSIIVNDHETSESNCDIHIDTKPQLPYEDVREISFCFFLKETIFFSINYLMDRFTFIFIYILYRFGNFEEATAVSGLIVLAVDLFFCFSRDFQEAIGIILGPYYSKGNSKKYYFFLVIIMFWNFVFFILCIPAIWFLPKFFAIIGAEEKLVDISTTVTREFMIFACPFLSISNFIKGIINIKQLQHYNFHSTMLGLLCFGLSSYISVLVLHHPYWGFTISFSLKYIVEIFFNLFIIFRLGKYLVFFKLLDKNPIKGKFSQIKNYSLKMYLRNLWYPFTVAISDVTVFISINLSFLVLFYFLLLGGNQVESLQVTNVYIEICGLSRE